MRPWKTSRPVAQLRAGRNDWYRIEASAGSGTAAVYVYDEIGYFGVTAGQFVDALTQLQVDRIEVHLNSPGGDVFDSVSIYNALVDHPAAVDVVVDGLAASGASVIAMAGANRTMNPGSQMMIHDPHGMAIGSAQDMRDYADLMDTVAGQLASIYQATAGGRLDRWQAAMTAETWYTPEEAMTAGLATALGGGKQQQAPAASFDLSIYNYAGRAAAPAPEPSASDPLTGWDFAAIRRAFEEATA